MRTRFFRLKLPVVAVLTLLACAMLSSCAVQKRTTAPGWHVERSSRHAPSVQVHVPKPNDDILPERSDLRKLMPVVPRASKSVQVSRVDRRLETLRKVAFARALQAQEVHKKDIRCVVPEHGSETSTTTTAGIMPIPSWEQEVLRLLESARKKRRIGVVCLTYGISWLVAAKHQKEAERLCVSVGSNLETVAPEALQRANEMKQKRANRWIAWFFCGLLFIFLAGGFYGVLFVGLLSYFWDSL